VSWDLYTLGFFHLAKPAVLLAVFLGSVWGLIFGALPGLTTTMAIALMIPLTFGADPLVSIAFLIGAYFAGIYGGSISAILISIPGTPAAMATVFDGYKMGQKGEAGRAIGLATAASCIGGLLGLLTLAVLSPIIARFALEFSAHETVGLALWGLSVVAYIAPGSTLKGLVGATLGLLIGCIGFDRISAWPRFSFGIPELLDGVEIVPVSIGLFGLAEVFLQAEAGLQQLHVTQRIRNVFPDFREFFRHWATILRSGLIGIIVGVIPAASPSMAAMVSYGQEKRFSKHGDAMGTGSAAGIIAPETANNACMGGDLVPLLSLGIPGDPISAILGGAFIIHGLRPGPWLFRDSPDFISTLFWAFLAGIIITFFLGVGGAQIWARVLNTPRFVLLPIILVLCVTGSYAIGNSLFDVGLLLLFGVLGYLFKKVGIGPAAIVLGLILGPMLEENLRRALVLGQGSLLPFLTRPISLILLLLVAITLILSFRQHRTAAE
jgi:putative tricarboxylic transport membrane protein